MRVFAKYLLLELPSWGAAFFLLYGLHTFFGLYAWLAVGLFFALVLKDLVMFPFLRDAYGSGPSTLIGPELLVGQRGVVDDDLSPAGWVVVRGERWRGRLALSTAPARRGDAVVVRAVRGLVLEVEAVPETGSEAPRSPSAPG